MNRISCLIIESDQEAIRHIDILGRTIGSVETRWKTNSLETGISIIRKHLPEMVIVGLGQDPSASIEAISTLSRDFPALYLLALSDKSDADLILRAMRAGAHDFLCKPVKERSRTAAGSSPCSATRGVTAPRRLP
jgi:DNA-binding NarL/FixJ family response regulator